MTTPALYVFALSHYCEKARWALDYFGIDHRVLPLAPGPHIKFSRHLGVADTTLPILVAGELRLQGSARIVDWAQAHGASSARDLEAAADSAACRAIEQRLDDVFGVHVRRYYYSETLFTQPQAIRPIFTDGLPWQEKIILRLAWGEICRHMIRDMDLGAAQGLESRQIIESELDWLDGLLANGRQHLVGERFSRADLGAASLLAPLALPPQHPCYHRLPLPPGVAADINAWRQRPSLRWVREIYRNYR